MRRRILSLGSLGMAAVLVAGIAGTLPATAGPAAVPASVPEVAPVAGPDAAEPAAPQAFTPAAPNPAIPAGYDQVAETPNLRLYINAENSKLIVEDKRSGKLWTSNPLQPLSDQKSLLDDAVFTINYTNARRQMTNLGSSASEQPQISVQRISNGARVVYNLQKLKIEITIDYTINEEPSASEPGKVRPYLQATIPEGGIKEGGDCSVATSTTCAMVVTLEMLPLFGATPVGDQGYLMVPDGAGAIVSFKPEYPQYRQRYSAQIYGPDAAAQAFQGFTGGRGGGMQVTRPYMPIWGLKDGDSAYAGIVTEGQYQANINGYLAGYITNANRASVEFIYRRQASIPRRRTLFVNRIEDNQIPGERQVRYVLLTGEDANYAGMAKAYRDYLLTHRGVQRLPKETPRPLLDLFMGITRRTAFKDTFVPMTTFDQGITILKAFLDKGLKNFDVHLIGWEDAGYRGNWPRRYPADSALGGNAGLKRLINFAHENGIRVYLEDDYIFGYTMSSGGIIGQIPYVRNIWPNWSYGFNTRFDTMRGVNKLPVFGGTSGIDVYLLNPVIARTRYAERDLPKHKEMGADGVIIRSMGSLLASDTNDRYPLSRDQVAAEWMKIVDMEAKALGHAAVQGPNDYVIGHTDRVYDAPVNSLDAFGDTPVPVYHIATQGLVTRLTIMDNLRNDPKTEFLRQIEWGMQPDYQLTYAPSSDLIRTNYNRLYSSQYQDWVEPAVKEYKQMADEFGYLNSLFITNHEILANRVYRVTYEDGSQLLVNYNPTDYDGPEGHVPAYGYVLRKGH